MVIKPPPVVMFFLGGDMMIPTPELLHSTEQLEPSPSGWRRELLWMSSCDFSMCTASCSRAKVQLQQASWSVKIDR